MGDFRQMEHYRNCNIFWL